MYNEGREQISSRPSFIRYVNTSLEIFNFRAFDCREDIVCQR